MSRPLRILVLLLASGALVAGLVALWRPAARDGAASPRSFALATAVPHLGQKLTVTLRDGDAQVRVHYATAPDAAALQWLTPEQTHDHAAPPASTPKPAAFAGVCGRHTATASAGASVANAENETAPAGWTPIATAFPSTWTLTLGDGTKTVTLWLKDAAGNISSASGSHSSASSK